MVCPETYPNAEPIVMLVDDDAHVRDAMENLLSSVGIESMAFASAREFLQTNLPDRLGCVVLDVRMPGLSGLDLHQHMARHGMNTPVVFLTGHGDIAMSVEAMKAGAIDFLTKPVRDQTLLDSISRAIETDRIRREETAASRRHLELYETLTFRERQVLKLVITGALNKQIAYELGITETTVKLHRSNMMKKLKVNAVTQLFTVCQSLSRVLYDLEIGRG
ncbi:response regulator transcription factor [Rhizobium sp. Root1220]|uniref:response regulator transcription factor n=1 Tax=Rhizobium sp. Root1220 TaxID=1736432 RepID=UPI0006F24843|nr:response regulator transcription factor [Rhizobium sp. Root1220]KQV73262.1 LuxR family transcriptional regulator [Rhizobium sp. Root1220]